MIDRAEIERARELCHLDLLDDIDVDWLLTDFLPRLLEEHQRQDAILVDATETMRSKRAECVRLREALSQADRAMAQTVKFFGLSTYASGTWVDAVRSAREAAARVLLDGDQNE